MTESLLATASSHFSLCLLCPPLPCGIPSSQMRLTGYCRACQGGGSHILGLELEQNRLHLHFPPFVIAVSPKITEISSDISINEGGNVSLTCIATGRPDPTITWRHISPKGKSQTSPQILCRRHKVGCKQLGRCRWLVQVAKKG